MKNFKKISLGVLTSLGLFLQSVYAQVTEFALASADVDAVRTGMTGAATSVMPIAITIAIIGFCIGLFVLVSRRKK